MGQSHSDIECLDRNWLGRSRQCPDFDYLSGLGVNTASDATNKLSVAADATLLTHNGAGHQLEINKAAGRDTASLLYQTNLHGPICLH